MSKEFEPAATKDTIVSPDTDIEILEDDNGDKSEAYNDDGDDSEIDENDEFDVPESLKLYNDDFQETQIFHQVSVDSYSAVPTNAQEDLQDIESLTPQDVADMMNQTVQSVGEILQLPATTIRLLLNFYKWDSSKMMEVFYSGEQEEMFTKANISLPPETSSTNCSEECDICYNTLMMKENSASLECGHTYHKDCWASYLATKIVDDGACQSIRCPGCEAIVDDDLVTEVLENKAVVDKYWALVTNTFVEHHRNLRWCPSPGCNMVVRMEVPSAQCVTCGTCQEEFCFKCGRPDHDFIPCYIMDMWDNREKGIDGKGYFSEVLTRQCPGCGTTIEKISGCNHMRCRCGAQFCWWCLKNHSNHTIEESCVNHVRTETEQDIIDASKDEAKFENIRKRRAKFKLSMGKTLLAISRYLPKRVDDISVETYEPDDGLGRRGYSYSEAVVTLDEMKERMSDDLGCFQTDHIKKSIHILMKSQKTLMNMEIMVYFLDASDNALFLVNLNDLEKVVRELSQLLMQMQTNFKGCNERKKSKLDHQQECSPRTFNTDGNLKPKIHVSQDSEDWITKLVREAEADKGQLSDKSSLCRSRREAIRNLVRDRAKQFLFRTVTSKSGAM